MAANPCLQVPCPTLFSVELQLWYREGMTEEPRKKAGLWQVAVTIFFALLMIGRKDTWEKEGTTVTLAQMIVGAIIGAVVVIGGLVLLVRLATH